MSTTEVAKIDLPEATANLKHVVDNLSTVLSGGKPILTANILSVAEVIERRFTYDAMYQDTSDAWFGAFARIQDKDPQIFRIYVREISTLRVHVTREVTYLRALAAKLEKASVSKKDRAYLEKICEALKIVPSHKEGVRQWERTQTSGARAIDHREAMLEAAFVAITELFEYRADPTAAHYQVPPKDLGIELYSRALETRYRRAPKAFDSEHLAWCKLFADLEGKAMPHFADPQDIGHTALHGAIEKKVTEIVKQLRDAGLRIREGRGMDLVTFRRTLRLCMAAAFMDITEDPKL